MQQLRLLPAAGDGRFEIGDLGLVIERLQVACILDAEVVFVRPPFLVGPRGAWESSRDVARWATAPFPHPAELPNQAHQGCRCHQGRWKATPRAASGQAVPGPRAVGDPVHAWKLSISRFVSIHRLAHGDLRSLGSLGKNRMLVTPLWGL
jgi:hypothetical protein